MWKLLETGDTIQIEDQFYSTSDWVDCTCSIGSKLTKTSRPHRRFIRIENEDKQDSPADIINQPGIYLLDGVVGFLLYNRAKSYHTWEWHVGGKTVNRFGKQISKKDGFQLLMAFDKNDTETVERYTKIFNKLISSGYRYMLDIHKLSPEERNSKSAYPPDGNGMYVLNTGEIVMAFNVGSSYLVYISDDESYHFNVNGKCLAHTKEDLRIIGPYMPTKLSSA